MSNPRVGCSDEIPGVQMEEGHMFQQTLEPRIEALFNQKHSKKVRFDLQNVILLDSQSTMDLFCNPKLVQKIKKPKSTMKLQSNGGHYGGKP